MENPKINIWGCKYFRKLFGTHTRTHERPGIRYWEIFSHIYKKYGKLKNLTGKFLSVEFPIFPITKYGKIVSKDGKFLKFGNLCTCFLERFKLPSNNSLSSLFSTSQRVPHKHREQVNYSRVAKEREGRKIRYIKRAFALLTYLPLPIFFYPLPFLSLPP